MLQSKIMWPEVCCPSLHGHIGSSASLNLYKYASVILCPVTSAVNSGVIGILFLIFAPVLGTRIGTWLLSSCWSIVAATVPVLFCLFRSLFLWSGFCRILCWDICHLGVFPWPVCRLLHYLRFRRGLSPICVARCRIMFLICSIRWPCLACFLRSLL